MFLKGGRLGRWMLLRGGRLGRWMLLRGGRLGRWLLLRGGRLGDGSCLGVVVWEMDVAKGRSFGEMALA